MEFDWEIPFSAADLDQDVPRTIKYERAMQSMVYQYPLKKKHEQWSQLSALEPCSFKTDLLGWQAKFAHLQNSCRPY